MRRAWYRCESANQREILVRTEGSRKVLEPTGLTLTWSGECPSKISSYLESGLNQWKHLGAQSS